MKNETNKKTVTESKKESAESLKKQSVQKNPTQKGYNEKNPAQPQGSFTPDSKSGKKP